MKRMTGLRDLRDFGRAGYSSSKVHVHNCIVEYILELNCHLTMLADCQVRIENDLEDLGPQLSSGVQAQLAQLVSVGSAQGAGRGGSTIWDNDEAVRLDEWLTWLVDAYIDSKQNASTLFEALYDRRELES